jgi:hypothetical protein
MQIIRDLEKTRDETLRYFSLDQRDLTRTYAALQGRPDARA